MSSIPGIDSRAPRAHRDEQRVVRVAEPLAGLLLEPRERLGDLLVEPVGLARPALHVGDARLGRDREARRARARRRGCASSRRRWRPCRRAGRASRASPRRSRRRTSCRRSSLARVAAGTALRRAQSCAAAQRRSRTCAWCSTRLARSPARPGAARAPARRAPRRAGGRAPRPGTRAPPRRAGTRPPRTRCTRRRPRRPRSRSGARARRTTAQARELRREARGEQQLEAEGQLVGVRRRRPASASSSASSLASRWKTGGLGSSVSNSRRDRVAGAGGGVERGARSRRRACASTVSAPVTVSRSLRPSCSTAHGEERLQAAAEAAARAAHALGDRADAPAVRACRGAGCGPPRRSASSAARSPRS